MHLGVADGVATLVLDRPPRNALTAGFADALVAALGAVVDDVVGHATGWARAVAERTSPSAVAATRTLLRALPADAASAAESRTITRLIGEPDCTEGVAAFLERRRPHFAPRAPG